jgi:hypothetical protein
MRNDIIKVALQQRSASRRVMHTDPRQLSCILRRSSRVMRIGRNTPKYVVELASIDDSRGTLCSGYAASRGADPCSLGPVGR